MEHLLPILAMCWFLGGCMSSPRIFDKLSFEDHRQIVNIYGDMYGDIIIQNPDGYDEYRQYLKPRTIFVERDRDTREEAQQIADEKYTRSRQLSWECGSVPTSSGSSTGVTYTAPVREKTYSTPAPVRSSPTHTITLGVGKRVH